MRILFSFAGGQGHFLPVAPIARAARAAGHAVAFGCQPALLDAVRGAGFAGSDAGGNTTGTARRPLLAVDIAREREVVQRAYAGRIARERAGRLMALARDWRPDVLVCDEMDFGAVAAAQALGLPAAVVLVIGAADFAPPDLLAAPLAALRAGLGLGGPGPRPLLLSQFPAALRPDPAGEAVFRFRPGAFGPAPDLAWRDGLPPGPVVHATLGTVFNLESGDLFARLLAGLRELPASVVMTVGREIDPAEFGPLPDRIRVLRHVPVDSLLPSCRLVVSQGGSGIVTASLAHGLPSLLLPMGADQPLTAARCAALGVARLLDPVTATAQAIRAGAEAMLADPAARAAAGRIAAEMAFPDAAAAARRIAALG